MQYTAHCPTPLGEILLACDEAGLTGLWFSGAKYYGLGLPPEHEHRETPVFQETRRWLELYFSGREPDFTPPLHMSGTPFQCAVWELLQEIPYSKTTTYGQLSRLVAARLNVGHLSARAVGGAVGRNKISILIPCHRVLGSNGSLTGYAGGIDKKIRLLEYEGADAAGLFFPKGCGPGSLPTAITALVR